MVVVGFVGLASSTMARHQMPMPDWRSLLAVLVRLQEEKRLTARELCGQTALSRTCVDRCLGFLIARELVQRGAQGFGLPRALRLTGRGLHAARSAKDLDALLQPIQPCAAPTSQISPTPSCPDPASTSLRRRGR